MIFAWIVCSAIRRLAAKAMNKSVDRGPFLKGECDESQTEKQNEGGDDS